MRGDLYSIENVSDIASEIAGEAMDLYLALYHAKRESIDPLRLAKSQEDMAHHLRQFAAGILTPSDKSLFDYLSWLKALFDGLGFTDNDVTASFRCVGHAAAPHLQADSARVFADCISRAVSAYANPTLLNNRYLEENCPRSGPSRAYLEALINGRRDLALATVEGEAGKGLALSKLYLDIFQPAQRELGRLWLTKKISVAQEHFASSATQYIMSTLYGKLFAAPPQQGKTLIAACAQGELHELGLRMVCDFLQTDGWDTRFFGANLPVDALLQEVRRVKPGVLALSATMLTNVRWVEKAIQCIKDEPSLSCRFLVGGAPFIVDPDLFKAIGADATAADCLKSLESASALLGRT